MDISGFKIFSCALKLTIILLIKIVYLAFGIFSWKEAQGIYFVYSGCLTAMHSARYVLLSIWYLMVKVIICP